MEKELFFRDKYYIPSTRWTGYDYSQNGIYFVTICTNKFKSFFGDIVNEKMELNKTGEIASRFWEEIPRHFKNVDLMEFVIMPNHLHGILIIDNKNKYIDDSNSVETRHGASLQDVNCYKNKFGPLSKNSLSLIINSYKSSVKRWCNQNNFNDFAWQPRFYDRVVRNEDELGQIRKYIIENPLKWALDKENPDNINT